MVLILTGVDPDLVTETVEALRGLVAVVSRTGEPFEFGLAPGVGVTQNGGKQGDLESWQDSEGTEAVNMVRLNNAIVGRVYSLTPVGGDAEIHIECGTARFAERQAGCQV